MLGLLMEMSRTPKQTTPDVPHVGRAKPLGAKRGSKVKRQNPINDLVVQYYDGDRKVAARVWGVSQSTLNGAISQGRLSAKLAIRIAEILKDKVTLEEMIALTKAPSQSDTDLPDPN